MPNNLVGLHSLKLNPLNTTIHFQKLCPFYLGACQLGNKMCQANLIKAVVFTLEHFGIASIWRTEHKS